MNRSTSSHNDAAYIKTRENRTTREWMSNSYINCVISITRAVTYIDEIDIKARRKRPGQTVDVEREISGALVICGDFAIRGDGYIP